MTGTNSTHARREYLMAVCDALRQYVQDGAELRLETQRLNEPEPVDIVSFTVTAPDRFQSLIRGLTDVDADGPSASHLSSSSEGASANGAAPGSSDMDAAS